MRTEAVPAILLALALGLALSFAPRRAAWVALADFVIVAAGTAVLWPDSLTEGLALIVCWTAVVLCIGAIYLPRTWDAPVPLALSVLAGVGSGAVAAVHGAPKDLLVALPFALIALPGAWVAARWSIVLKVLGSWLFAVALLSAVLPLVSTPGYEADHAE